MAEAHTTLFVMRGARDAMEGGFTQIEGQVKAIEQAVAENPGLAFDLAKTLIESTCIRMLRERSVDYSQTDDLPQLFKFATQHLSFLPPNVRDGNKVRKSLQRTLTGLNTAIHGICELRNECRFTSHGSAGERPIMESVQALLAAEAADTIVGFLHRVHRQDRVLTPASKADFDDNFAAEQKQSGSY